MSAYARSCLSQDDVRRSGGPLTPIESGVSMSSTERTQTERLLLSKLRELTPRSLRDGIPIDRAPDELDEVQQATERELALLTIERHSNLSEQIRLALQRLERGEYGKCIGCGNHIGSRRLKAVPWTSMCLTCQGDSEAAQRTAGPFARLGAQDHLREKNGRDAYDEVE